MCVCVCCAYANMYPYSYIRVKLTAYKGMCECIYLYMYYTMTDVYTTVMLPTKPSSIDGFGFRPGFGAEALFPVTQSAQAVTHDTTRLCWINVTQCDCPIHADTVSLILDLFIYLLLSDG